MSMLVSDFVPKAYYAATGKSTGVPTTGSAKWTKILNLANLLIDDWVNEPNVDWESLRLPDTNIGTVTTDQTFTLPSTIRKLSSQEGDVVRIVHADGVAFTDYDIIDADRVKDYAHGMRTYQNNEVSTVGSTLYFNRAFASTDPQFGGTIYVPAYGWPTKPSGTDYLVSDTDPIPVDNPNWLVYATASLFDSFDVTRQNLVPSLNDRANQLMGVMKSNNKGQMTRIYQPFRPLGENWVDEAWSY